MKIEGVALCLDLVEFLHPAECLMQMHFLQHSLDLTQVQWFQHSSNCFIPADISSLTNPKPNTILQSDLYQASSPAHCRQHFPLSESSSSLSTSISDWSTPNEDEDRPAGEDSPELEREEHHIVIVQPQGEALEGHTGGPF